MVVAGCVEPPGDVAVAPPDPVPAATPVPGGAPSAAPVPASALRPERAGPDLSRATRVDLWATVYSIPVVKPASGGVPMRDMKNRVIGPELARRDWCRAAVEGTVKVSGHIYRFAGTRKPRQATCRHRASSRARWKKARHPHALGASGNALTPFRSIACDVGRVRRSTPWVGGGYPAMGQRIYVPDADGVTLPDGAVHDGVFVCEDIGGKVTGNHIDVFLGEVPSGAGGAVRYNPFGFVGHRPGRTFTAWLLPKDAS